MKPPESDPQEFWLSRSGEICILTSESSSPLADTIYGVAQSRTRLKWLSSSSSSRYPPRNKILENWGSTVHQPSLPLHATGSLCWRQSLWVDTAPKFVSQLEICWSTNTLSVLKPRLDRKAKHNSEKWIKHFYYWLSLLSHYRRV